MIIYEPKDADESAGERKEPTNIGMKLQSNDVKSKRNQKQPTIGTYALYRLDLFLQQ